MAGGIRPGQGVQDRLAAAAVGHAAAGGKTAFVGMQMAVDRINKSGGINGRPVELVVADDESKPDVGRRKTEKLVDEDKIDVHVGGFLSNICLACMPVYEEYKIVNMISVCLDTTLTTSKCSRYTFRPPTLRRRRRWRSRPTSSTRWARTGTSPTPTMPGASRPATPTRGDQEEGRRGCRHHRHPARHRRHDAVSVEDHRQFRRLFGIFFGPDGVTVVNQAYDLGLTKKYKLAGDGAIAESTNLPAMGNKIEGFIGINRYLPVFQGPLEHAAPQVLRRRGGAAEEDRSVRSAARSLRAIELRGDERPQDRHGEVGVPAAATTPTS